MRGECSPFPSFRRVRALFVVYPGRLYFIGSRSRHSGTEDKRRNEAFDKEMQQHDRDKRGGWGTDSWHPEVLMIFRLPVQELSYP